MDEYLDQPVLPGNVVGTIAGAAAAVRLGPGLSQNGESILATKAGILRHRAPDKYWIENSQKRVRHPLPSDSFELVTVFLASPFSVFRSAVVSF